MLTQSGKSANGSAMMAKVAAGARPKEISEAPAARRKHTTRQRRLSSEIFRSPSEIFLQKGVAMAGAAVIELQREPKRQVGGPVLQENVPDLKLLSHFWDISLISDKVVSKVGKYSHFWEGNLSSKKDFSNSLYEG